MKVVSDKDGNAYEWSGELGDPMPIPFDEQYIFTIRCSDCGWQRGSRILFQGPDLCPWCRHRNGNAPA